MGTTVRLLANRSDLPLPLENIGSYNNLYGSIAKLDAMYFETKECQDMLLNTRISAEDHCRNLKISIDDMKPIQYYCCEDTCYENPLHKNSAQVSTSSNVKCKDCGRFLNRPCKIISSTSTSEEGRESVFVTKTSSFVITDDLHVIPNHPASTLRILESCGIKDFAVLEEKTLILGSNESQTDSKCTNTTKITVKLLVQKSDKKILLAQSSEDFVDFLFSLLTIPLGRVFSLLNRDNESSLSIENIYKSILELNVGEDLKSEDLKNLLLNPKLSMHYLCSNHIFPLEEDTYLWDKTGDGQYNGHFRYNSQTQEFTIQSRKGAGGFIAGLTKFMVTNDLVVTPLSSMSCFMYLHKLKVTPNDIEEQVVDIGIKEALNLLKASLRSTSVLTNGLKSLIPENSKQKTSLNKLESGRSLKMPKVEK